MTFRPQFSLRTLLLVTALIAVGAKLWHGPYHVVETIDGIEYECDYYRGFGWERIKHGVVIKRFPILDEGLSTRYIYMCDRYSEINFWRNGQDTNHLCRLHAFHYSGVIILSNLSKGVRLKLYEKLSEQEYQQLQTAIRKETDLLKLQGYEDVIEDLRSNNTVKQLPDNIKPEPTPDNDVTEYLSHAIILA